MIARIVLANTTTIKLYYIMSFNKLDNLYDELQNIINDNQSDVTKFVEGNNSAGTRVRKAMQKVKALAQEVRVEVQDQKNAQF